MAQITDKDGLWEVTDGDGYTSRILLEPSVEYISGNPVVVDAIDSITNVLLSNIDNMDFGDIPEGMLVLIDDDGRASTLTHTAVISQAKNVPITVSLYQNSELLSNETYRTQLNSLFANNGWEVASHASTSLTGKTVTELDTFFTNQLAYFQGLGFAPTSHVYGYGTYDTNLLAVVAKHFKMGVKSSESGNTINTKRQNRYLLNRYWIDDASNITNYQTKIDDAIANKKLLILGIHGNELADSATYTHMENIIDYAITSGVKITTLQGAYDAI